MTPLMAAWLAELVIITYRGAKQESAKNNPIPHLVIPSQYASTFIIYGALSFIPGQGQKFAGAVGWGLVVATLLNLWTPGKNGAVSVSQTASNQAPTKNADTGQAQTGS